MTQAQIERYEQLRLAKAQIELVLDACSDPKFCGFSSSIDVSDIPTMIIPEGKAHRYITEKSAVLEIQEFLKHLLDSINEQINNL